MNKRNFVTKVKDSITEISQKDLQTILIEFAEYIPSEEREELLDFLQSFSGSEQKNGDFGQYQQTLSGKTMEEKEEEIIEWLDQIEEQELFLEGDIDEDEEDYYWDEDPILEYTDSDGVGERIMAAFEFAKDCVNEKRYKESIKVFDRILDIGVYVENDYEEIVLDLEELVKENIIEVDLEELAKMILYADYQIGEMDRVEDLYYYFRTYAIFQNIHLEDIRHMGKEELKDEDTFWENWIEFLASEQGKTATRLLKEAILYKEGSEGLAQTAEKYYEKHPMICLDALTDYEQKQEYQKMLAIGVKAVELIDEKLKIRSEIAMKVSFAEHYLGNDSEMKKFWFEAYRSSTTVVDYLRLFLDEELATSYGMKAKDVKRITAEGYYNYNQELAENIISTDMDQCLDFLSGEFEKTKNACTSFKKVLGWSGEFIGIGINLFLLYFYQDRQLRIATAMTAKGISEYFGFRNQEEFYFLEKSNSEIKKDNENTFWMAFYKWKNYFQMEDAQKEQYLQWIESVIEQRVKAIVGGQYRNKYESVAILIAVLGEVKESMGIARAGQELKRSYKSMFPRHSAFHGAMNRYIR